uniref:uncharacterized protein LOC122597824 n=1 Tax=Erigeron canadensis TaxID=72917 RepID=UPI001CB948F4|nr:uncharacterized protein LOC122597824 [Erigeron canadensis]
MGENNDFNFRGNLLNTFSALTINGSHQNETNLGEQEQQDVLVEQQEQEIMELRRHLAEYAAKEAQIKHEKQVLENRIASIYKGFDQQQRDLVEATAKAISYRQGIVEENIRLEYALQVAQEERSIFISNLVPLLSDVSLRPNDLDAYSIVSSLRILFKHSKERLVIAEEKLRDLKYQPLSLQSQNKELSLKEENWVHPMFSPSPETSNYTGVERQTNGDEMVNSHYLPSILEEPSTSSQVEADEDDDLEDDNVSDEYDDEDVNRPLPTIEGLQILGEAFPGHEIQASGYSRNGTTHCGFEWVRHLQDGSVNYIEGAKQPMYTVTADDVDSYLAVEVQPLDDRQRKGELVTCFANANKKITCHPDMVREIENTLRVGHVSFRLLVWNGPLDTWEPANLEIKKSTYSIKLDGPNNGVVVDSKYTPTTLISLPAEIPLEFSILGPGGVEHYLRADENSADISCSRDTIVLTLRLFVKRAADKKLGKKKRRVLFFK